MYCQRDLLLNDAYLREQGTKHVYRKKHLQLDMKFGPDICQL